MRIQSGFEILRHEFEPLDFEKQTEHALTSKSVICSVSLSSQERFCHL